jgi:hypothetical protein
MEELVPIMSIYRQVIGASLLLAGTAFSALAAEPTTVLFGGNSINLDGLTITIDPTVGSCKIDGSNCTATDGLVLEGVSTGRGTITFEVANATLSSNILSTTTPNSATQSLSVKFDITPNTSWHGGGIVKGATGVSMTGIDECTSGIGHTCVGSSASATLSTGWTPTSLSASLPVSTTSSSLVSGSSGSSVLSPNSNTFTVSESLTLNPTSKSGSALDLTIQTLAFHLTTAPEPASMSVLLVGVGALMASRRRRHNRVAPDQTV